MSWAKEYLRQVRRMDIQIDNMQATLGALRIKAESIGSFDYEKPRVKSSSSGDELLMKVAAVADYEKKIDRAVDRYIDFRQKVTEQINSLEDERYIVLLSRMYLEYGKYRAKLEKVAESMNYSYDHMRRLHGEALMAFEEKYKPDDEDATKCHNRMC